MSRNAARHLVALLLCAASLLPVRAAHAGAWSTWLQMVSTNDLLALRDTVWVATGEAGIIRYIRDADRFESLTREPGGLASNSVNVLCFDRSGRLWAGTAGKGVSRLSADGTKWDLVNAFDGLPSDTVTALRADGDTVWVGTTRGIALWDGHQVAGSVPDVGTPSPFRSNFVTGIVVRGDSLFIGTADGIWLARLSDLARNRDSDSTWSEVDSGIPTTAISGLATDGTRLFALANRTVYALNPGSGVWGGSGVGNVDKLRDDFQVILADSPDHLYEWDGTQWTVVSGSGAAGSGAGALRAECGADPSGAIFNIRIPALFEQLQPGGTAWVTHAVPGPVSNQLLNVVYDGTYAWLGSDAGISRFDGATWRNFTSKGGASQDTTFVDPSSAFMMQEDNAGRLWVANWSTAIERVDPHTSPMHVDHVFLSPNTLGDAASAPSWGWSGAVDPTGFVYVGGDSRAIGSLDPYGIAVYDPNATMVANWNTRNTAMSDNQVRGLAVDRNRVLWAGFANAGVSWAYLDSLDSTPGDGDNDHLRLPVFHADSAFVTSAIFGVVAHGDSIWVLTTANLQRFRASTKNVPSRYEIAASVAPRGAVHPLDVGPDGTAWVGTGDGLRRYLPGGGSQDYRENNSPLASNEVRSVFVDKATGAVWIATAAGLNRFDPHYQPPPPPAIARLQMKLWPNPASLTAAGVQLRLAANTPSVTGEVIDLNGRLVRRFRAVAAGGVVWDGRDANGGLVPPGVYFVHANGGGHEAMARVVVLR